MRYAYKCKQCDLRFDEEFPLGQAPEKVACGVCMGGQARRVFTVPPVHYRGTGWSGAAHGVPDMDEREKLPGPLEFGDLLEE
ncbi:MAG: hypothetical protein GWN58_25585 [Anaerolineae bacterium]|nr:hypothetical protein [Anaerolineae bacterium]